MTTVTDIERITQNELVAYFRETLGYDYLGNWQDRDINTNIEEEYLRKWLEKQYPDYGIKIIDEAIDKLKKIATEHSQYNCINPLYKNNKAIYECLKYPIQIRGDDGKFKNISFIDWKSPNKNHFAIAEEVTIHGKSTCRPDIILYLNGIAVCIIELKRSSVSVATGIRQNIGNQEPEYIQDFFSTVQILIAGNETEGVRYGTIKTKESYYLRWMEEDGIENRLARQIREIAEQTTSPLKKEITYLCQKERFLDIIRNYIIFDGGIKKLARHNQYFAVTSTLQRINEGKGGIIWHTQGSGKSLTMVWLSARIALLDPSARVIIITDRKELDKQIKDTFEKTGNTGVVRAESGDDLTTKIRDPANRIICTLIHKFGEKNTAFEKLLNDIKIEPNTISGNFYIFIDECHRTQSGKLHRGMKRLFSDSIIIGFTGTPLLKTDLTSVEVFGGFIHEYTYDMAVNEKVVLDLLYESRNVEQFITSEDKIDEWFEINTKDLTTEGKNQLKNSWGKIKKLYSAKDRISRIVGDICFDMVKLPRLSDGRGNAILIADSISNACRYWELFQETNELSGHCGLLTSYDPSKKNIKLEESGEGKTEEQYKEKIHKMAWGKLTPQAYEDAVIDAFKNEPCDMKLIIVVDRFLTGFDAPSATYLYIDKHKENHGLFQAICRVNRLDTPDKMFGYIIDYENLFNEVKQALIDYTDGSLMGNITGGSDEPVNIDRLLKDKLTKSYYAFMEAVTQLDELCSPLYPSLDLNDYIAFFCSKCTTDTVEAEANYPKREKLYRWTSSLLHTWADIKLNIREIIEKCHDENITPEWCEEKVKWYTKLKDDIGLASQELIDLTRYGPAMRTLIDRYVGANDSKVLAKFEHEPLLDLIEAEGIETYVGGTNSKDSKRVTAEIVERNIAKTIVEKKNTNPKYFDRMSSILQSLILEKNQETIDYTEYLKKLETLVTQINHPERDVTYPEKIRQSAVLRSFYEETGKNESFSLELDHVYQNRADGWRQNEQKQREIKKAAYDIIKKYMGLTASDDEIIKIVEKINDIAMGSDEYK